MGTGQTRRKTLALALVCACATLPLGGCGGVKRVSVSGAVTLDGAPLQGGVLLFHPDAARGNTNRASCTGPVSNGRYTLVTTGVTRDETGQGAPLGWYKVTLINDLPGMAEIKVNSKYLNPETTPLEVEIVEDPKPGAYDLEFKKSPGGATI